MTSSREAEKRRKTRHGRIAGSRLVRHLEVTPALVRMTSSPAVTDLLLRLRSGDRAALDRLTPIVYDELMRIAHRHMQGESDGHTLNTTALAHEAWLKLVDVQRVDWQDRSHFLAMASRAMRRILIDHARERSAARRGGGVVPLPLDEAAQVAAQNPESLIALDDALNRLAELNARLAQVVECRYFGGLTEDETAAALGVTTRTVQRDWVKARGWLHGALVVPNE
jgi:RNA polymerase sigma factor (TIGR02999 family)